MKSYEILPHTGDVAVRVIGSTRAGFAVAAMQGMFAAAGPRIDETAAPVERPFSVSAEDFESLLVDLLNEAVSQSGINREAYDDIRFTLLTDRRVEGSFIGKKIFGFTTEIKAATHHNLKIVKNAAGDWEAVVVFDV